MKASKWFIIIFAAVIIAGLIITFQGVAATTSEAESVNRSEMVRNASSARWSGLAARSLRANSAQAGRLTQMANYYSAHANKVNAAQASRLELMADMYKNNLVRVNNAQAARLTAMTEYYSKSAAAHQRIIKAEAARWSGLAARYQVSQP